MAARVSVAVAALAVVAWLAVMERDARLQASGFAAATQPRVAERFARADADLRGARLLNPDTTPDLARALLHQGLRRFVVLGAPPRVVTARERSDAFADAVRDGGGVVVDLLETEFSRDGGHDAGDDVARLVRGERAADPLCVFAVTDVLAIGVIARLRELGLRVPDDVRVAGFDDVPTLRDHVPALTTVRIPLEEMGRLAVVAALGEDGAAAPDVVGHEVVLRASTTG
jgi:LacI family transcriptional regulator